MMVAVIAGIPWTFTLPLRAHLAKTYTYFFNTQIATRRIATLPDRAWTALLTIQKVVYLGCSLPFSGAGNI